MSSWWLPQSKELAFFGPGLALIGTMVLVLIGSLLVGKRAGITAFLVIFGAIIAFFLNILVYENLSEVSTPPAGLMEPNPLGGMLLADPVTVIFNFFLIFFLVLITGLWQIGSAYREKDAPEFFILLLASALGMSLMVSTLNLLMIVVAIELASLPSYAIVAFDKKNRQGAEGAIKYVIFGSVCAAIMLYGVSLLYGLFGTLDLLAIAPEVIRCLQDGQNLMVLTMALFAFMVGIAFKISAVPFHFWCPDVFEGAKIEVTTWLSVASKMAGIFLLLRIMFVLASSSANSSLAHTGYLNLKPMTVAIGLFAAITCLVGNLSAYRQTSVKRILAYSSIAHAGYMLMLAAVVLTPDVSPKVWMALISYMFMYLLMNLGAFGATALVVWQTGSDGIENFNGLGRRSPGLAFGMTLCLFSLIGMPPLGGFLAKWWLLVALANSGGWLWSLIIWASLNTVFSLFFYMRIIKHMYLIDDGRARLRVPLSGVLLVNACALMLLLAGTLLVNPIKAQAYKYSEILFAQPESRAISQSAYSVDSVEKVQ